MNKAQLERAVGRRPETAHCATVQLGRGDSVPKIGGDRAVLHASVIDGCLDWRHK